MKAIILAAGIGSRLGYPLPKGLLKMPSGESILSRQIRILKAEGISDITIVVGYKKELIMSELKEVQFYYNPDFRTTNTSKSLLFAIREFDNDILWINGDLVYDREIITGIKSQKDNTIIVNDAKCGEEEVKYQLDENNNVCSISKEVNNARGEALGINIVNKETLKEFITALEDCDDNDYFERAMQILIDKGIIFKSRNVSNYRCIEVDFAEDWEKALAMFS